GALAAALLTSMLMFAAFTLLLQPKALPTAQLGKPSGSEMQPIALNPVAHHELVAAIAANLKLRYVDRALGQRLADAVLAQDKNGEYESPGMTAALAARLNRDIQVASRALGIPGGVFVADVAYSARPLPAGPPPPITAAMRERTRAMLLQQNCLFETI